MAITLAKSLRDVSMPLFALAQGNLSYDQAVQKGEIWTKAALKLALTVALFFSLCVASSMNRSVLVAVSVATMCFCIHPFVSMDALFLFNVSEFIPLARRAYLQYCISRSLLADLKSKNLFNREVFQLTPEVFQPLRDSVRKGSAVLIPVTIQLLAELSTILFPLTEKMFNNCPRIVRWVDQKIVTASKVAAPHIASCFGYQQPAD